MRGTWFFSFDKGHQISYRGQGPNGYDYNRVYDGVDGSRISGLHRIINNDGTLGSLSEIIFDTDGTGIVGNSYVTETPTGNIYTWTAIDIGENENNNHQLTILIHAVTSTGICLRYLFRNILRFVANCVISSKY